MNIVQMTNVNKSFSANGQRNHVLNDVNLSLMEGTILGLLGKNGAGKTTIIRAVTGLIEVDEGEITVFSLKQPKYRRRISEHLGIILEGDRNLFWYMSVLENIKFFIRISGNKYRSYKKEVDELLYMFGLSNKQNSKVTLLSRGMRQKLSLVLAYMLNPKLIIFDEPTIGLDIETTAGLVELFNRFKTRGNTAAIISSHDTRFLKTICNEISHIQDGHIVENKSCKDNKTFELYKCFEIYFSGVPSSETISLMKSHILDLSFVSKSSDFLLLRVIPHNDDNLLSVVQLLNNNGHGIQYVRETKNNIISFEGCHDTITISNN